MALTFTPNAIEHLAKVRMDQKFEGDVPLRLSLKGGGCAGFEYHVAFDREDHKGDRRFTFSGPAGEVLGVVVDPKSYLFLNGIEVDFQKTLMDSKFVFNNPNATRTCGCGTSFDVA